MANKIYTWTSSSDYTPIRNALVANDWWTALAYWAISPSLNARWDKIQIWGNSGTVRNRVYIKNWATNSLTKVWLYRATLFVLWEWNKFVSSNWVIAWKLLDISRDLAIIHDVANFDKENLYGIKKYNWSKVYMYRWTEYTKNPAFKVRWTNFDRPWQWVSNFNITNTTDTPQTAVTISSEFIAWTILWANSTNKKYTIDWKNYFCNWNMYVRID